MKSSLFIEQYGTE